MRNKLVKIALKYVILNNVKTTFFLIFAIVGVVLTSLIPPQILRHIIDNNLTLKNYDGLMLLAGIYIAVLLFIGIFDFIKEAILTIFGQKITIEIRKMMMEKLEKIDARYFSSNDSGTILSRFTNDVDAINVMFTSGIIGMVIDCFKIMGIVISIWIFSSKLGILTFFLIPVIYFITRGFQKRMLKAQIENRILVGSVNNHISESIKGILMIKSFSKEEYMEKRYKTHLLNNYQTIEKVNFYDSVFPPIIQITRAIVIGTIVILSSNQLNYLGISLGMIAASIDLFSNLFSPIENLGMELQSIQTAISGIRRVEDFYDEREDTLKNESLTSSHIISDSNHVSLAFNNVGFYYEQGTDVLQNIQLNINSEEKVTIVGRTGVGKSTLFKLILGLVKPTEGSISINGIDVYDIPNSEKRRIFGYVDQSFVLIKGTVAEQISLKDETITRDAIKKAIAFVGLEETVDALELGLDTVVASDSLFSQGQKQLLAIARAIVTNPPILLLDEITSNLDSVTEEKVVSVLQRTTLGHTILSISHRLSTMIACDTIVLLENGRVKNVGSPEVLFKSDAWYRKHMELEDLTWD